MRCGVLFCGDLMFSKNFLFLISAINSLAQKLPTVNSLTKYPSILTYHSLGQRGVLNEEIQVPFPLDADVLLTEKIDGTNARIIILEDGSYLLGSREELLYASGDLLYNTDMGIVDTIRNTLPMGAVPEFLDSLGISFTSDIIVLFMEVFGHGIQKAGQGYSGGKPIKSLRLFDVARIPQADFWEQLVEKTPAEAAAWRDAGGQSFVSTDELAKMSGIDKVPVVGSVAGKDLPVSCEATLRFLNEWTPESRCLLGEKPCRSEGLVLRTKDRKSIAKVRFEDYERTMRARK